MNIADDTENNVKKQSAAQKTAHIDADIGETSVSARHKVLNAFIHAWRDDQKNKKIQKMVFQKRTMMERRYGEYAKNPVFGKVRKLPDEVMEKIKGNDDTPALNELHDGTGDLRTEIAG